MNVSVFDIECDGLTPTRIHCLVARVGGKLLQFTDYKGISRFLLNADILIGHNICRFDIPVIERLLGIRITARLVDTLALSWTLYPERNVHGLESWGEDFGVPKPPIADWENLSVEEYTHRCTEDVKINSQLWDKQYSYLKQLYTNENDLWRYIEYISFKMDCAKEQERSKWKLDVERCANALTELSDEKARTFESLRTVMPRVPIVVTRSIPKARYKKDGTVSATGARWFSLLKRNNLGDDFTGDVQEVIGEDEPNPGSPKQLKDWLTSLGWKPQTFKYVRDKQTNDVRAIPQINAEHGAGICDSIKLLYVREPRLELLDGLSVLSHRISILKGFLEAVDDDGYVKAEIQGLTNTLRFKHKVCVNLPKVDKPYGELIRGCLVADVGTELCGSDQSSLEDRLKQHFIYPYDPEYVNEMNVPDYDPHLSLALLASEVDEAQVLRYKSGEDKKAIKHIRDIFKNGNYACQYGCMPPKLALTANIPLKKAKMVWETYWKKNWAIKEVAKAQIIKKISGQMWLLNPVNGFYYSLRYEKDVFSTLIQGTASYVFDEWVRLIRSRRPQLTAQFHDEVVLQIKLGNRERCTALLNWAIDTLNNNLKLNRQLGISIDYGRSYADIH